MRREGIRQAKLGCEHRAESARTKDPQRHIRSGSRDGLDALVRLGRGEVSLQLQHVLREIFGGLRGAAQGPESELIGARRAAEPEIDAAWKQACQGAELLGDHKWGMVRKHDPAGTHPNGVGSGGHVGDHK
jgi:hypothetical protein